MSVVPKSMRSMRIVALPLTRPKSPPDLAAKSHQTFNPNRMLIYYHFHLELLAESSSDLLKQSRMKNLVKWVSTKAADIWAGFGKAPEGSWKLKTYEYGERLVDRIDFEELSLKGIDPSLGPSMTHPDFQGHQVQTIEDKGKEREQDKFRIPLLYPPSIYASLPATIMSDPSHLPLVQLRALLTQREPRHRKGFWTWMIIAPFTAPFMLVPVIPNLPFFFCVWRSWSHYRAYRASQYLASLIDHGLIIPTASDALDKLYISFAPSSVSSVSENPSSTSPSAAANGSSAGPTNQSTSGTKKPDQRLLTRKAIPHIMELFQLPESAAADMYRAVEQVRSRLGNKATGR